MEKLFTPMPKPEPGDWLASQKEKPQPFDSYKLPYVNFVTPDKRTIYLQPYGKFNKEFMEKLVAFCEVFYPGTLVKILPEKDLLASIPNIRHRKNCYGEQYVCDDILAYMKTCVPKDAYCVMGITLHDIYPGPNWNYVYGWATYRARVGIFSFLRWDE
jgi:archaemetzincin